MAKKKKNQQQKPGTQRSKALAERQAKDQKDSRWPGPRQFRAIVETANDVQTGKIKPNTRAEGLPEDYVQSRNVLDYSLYLFVGGEAWSEEGGFSKQAKNVKGNPTTGIGTDLKTNSIGWTKSEVTREEAVEAMQLEAYEKMSACIRTVGVKEFHSLLPCQQALLIDANYHGKLGGLTDFFRRGDMNGAEKQLLAGETNVRRKALRSRLFDMSRMIKAEQEKHPDMPAYELARLVGDQFYQKYKDKAKDEALTYDEMAMLYHSCNAACGVATDDKEAEKFAKSFGPLTVTPMCIGSDWQPIPFEERASFDAYYERKNGHSYSQDAKPGRFIVAAPERATSRSEEYAQQERAFNESREPTKLAQATPSKEPQETPKEPGKETTSEPQPIKKNASLLSRFRKVAQRYPGEIRNKNLISNGSQYTG